MQHQSIKVASVGRVAWLLLLGPILCSKCVLCYYAGKWGGSPLHGGVWFVLLLSAWAAVTWAGLALRQRGQIPVLVTVLGAAAGGAVFGLSVGWLINKHAGDRARCLREYCAGTAARISTTVSLAEIERGLQVLHSYSGADENPYTFASDKVPQLLKHALPGAGAPVALRWGAPGGTSSSIDVLWPTLGGARGLHYGDPPPSPTRPLDYSWHWSNRIWIIVRQE